ncbi:MAG: type II toxin-antitoxin system PemK/MazF family toxin [Nanoarchaeota archaeon]
MRNGTMFNQKDIILIPFPFSDLSGAKQRPALVISNKRINVSDDRICCLITSVEQKSGMPISTSDIHTGSLPLKSWIKPHRLFTINKNIVRKKICTISDEMHEKVIHKIHEIVKHL